MLPKGLLREYARAISIVLRALDVFAILFAGLAAFYYKFSHLTLSPRYTMALLLGGLFTLVIFQALHIYDSMRSNSFAHSIKKIVLGVVGVHSVMAILAFLTKTGSDFSREWFLYWAFSALVLLIVFRSVVLLLLYYMRSCGWNEKQVVIIGASELGSQLIYTIQQAMWTGFRIVTVFDDDVKEANTIQDIPIVKTPCSISDYLKQHPAIDEVWIALPLRAEERVRALVYDLRHHTLPIRYVLDMFGIGLLKQQMTHLAGFPTVNLNATPMVGVNRLIKALEDRLIALLILLLISPLFLIVAIGVKGTSRGPIFFKQHRHGWDGRIIKVYKFRTMYLHQEELGQVTQARMDDKRVTPFGRFLRKTSLDELPQFFNVLQGRMSIVGPRPHAVVHNEFYKDSIHAYMQRHKVKPGITGWAQINGWRGETDTLEKMQKRIEYDLYYIDNWSLWFDLKIITLTFFQGFINRNAY